jgi:hypothetical protein
MDPAMIERLKSINVDMAQAESSGSKAFFETLLATKFAFRRASGALEDRDGFLGGFKAGARRRCDPASVEVTPVGAARAFVTCVVEMEMEGGWKQFHNARLFVLDEARSWRLLAWANES